MDLKYEQEAVESWGNTAAFRQSQERTRSYTAEDWFHLRSERDRIERDFMDFLEQDIPADDDGVQGLTDDYHRHIECWFYDCPPLLFQSLAMMYVQDQRFRRHYEELSPGLAEYVSAAMLVWAQDNDGYSGGCEGSCGTCGGCG